MSPAAAAGEPVRLIIETDIFEDVDDVAALAVAHALADEQLATIEAICVNTPSRFGYRAVRIIGGKYGRAVPVGIRSPLTDAVAEHDYAKHLAGMFPTDDTEPAAAVDVLRAALAAAPSRSIVLVSLGFFHNLVGLLDSPPDAVSDLPGADLVADRVRETVVMGGRFPSGSEFNMEHDDPSAARAFGDRWPGPVTWFGWDEGVSVITARELTDTAADDDPVVVAIRRACGRGVGRSSWDPMTVHVAVIGESEHYGYSEPGRVLVDEDGRTTWSPGSGSHRLVVRRTSDERVAAAVDELLARAPASA